MRLGRADVVIGPYAGHLTLAMTWLTHIWISVKISPEVNAMHENHLWERAKSLSIQTSPEIVGGFNIGFDSKVPEAVKDVLMSFVYWVEDHFSMPVTLWVDFKYNHYLVDNTGKRVGYKFYWADWKPYPVIENPDDIPVIELPVRMEHSSIEEILFSFIQAISLYYTWLTGTIAKDTQPNADEAAEILYTYLNETNREVHHDNL